MDLSLVSDEDIWQEASLRRNKIANFTTKEYLNYYPAVKDALQTTKNEILEMFPDVKFEERTLIDPETGITSYDLSVIFTIENNILFEDCDASWKIPYEAEKKFYEQSNFVYLIKNIQRGRLGVMFTSEM